MLANWRERALLWYFDMQQRNAPCRTGACYGGCEELSKRQVVGLSLNPRVISWKLEIACVFERTSQWVPLTRRGSMVHNDCKTMAAVIPWNQKRWLAALPLSTVWCRVNTGIDRRHAFLRRIAEFLFFFSNDSISTVFIAISVTVSIMTAITCLPLLPSLLP